MLCIERIEKKFESRKRKLEAYSETSLQNLGKTVVDQIENQRTKRCGKMLLRIF